MRRAIRFFEPGYTKKQLSGQLMGFLVWLGITVAAFALRPDPSGHGTHTQLGLPPCPSVLLLDRPCPGCGLTTSFAATVHGDFSLAYSAHPLGSALYLGFTLYALAAIYGWARGFSLDLKGSWTTRLGVAAAVLFLGFGAVRAFTHDGYGTRPQERYAQQLLR